MVTAVADLKMTRTAVIIGPSSLTISSTAVLPRSYCPDTFENWKMSMLPIISAMGITIGRAWSAVKNTCSMATRRTRTLPSTGRLMIRAKSLWVKAKRLSMWLTVDTVVLPIYPKIWGISFREIPGWWKLDDPGPKPWDSKRFYRFLTALNRQAPARVLGVR